MSLIVDRSVDAGVPAAWSTGVPVPGIIQQYLCACSSSGIVWVETMASPPAASGGAIPSRIGQFECRVLLVAPTLKPNYNDGEEE